MKKALLLNILSFLLIATPIINCVDNDWQNKPLMRSQKESTVELAKENDKKIDNKKKNNTVWYKKPAVKYAIGGLTSAAFALYSFRQCMRHGISLPESNELSSQKMIPQQNPVNQNSVEDESIQSTQNVEKKEIESNKDIASQNKTENEQKISAENNEQKNPVENVGRLSNKKRISKFRKTTQEIEKNKEEVVNDDQKKQDDDHQNKKNSIIFDSNNNIPNNISKDQSELTPEQIIAAKNLLLGAASVIIIAASAIIYNMR